MREIERGGGKKREREGGRGRVHLYKLLTIQALAHIVSQSESPYLKKNTRHGNIPQSENKQC